MTGIQEMESLTSFILLIYVYQGFTQTLPSPVFLMYLFRLKFNFGLSKSKEHEI